jgi:2-polyprenyl-3-methyl-5-hydroxy-6-metoxy-1,4-benzoquinol methylase
MSGSRHPTLAQRDTELREMMDDPQCDPVRLRRTLQRFSLVNRLVAGWDDVYRAHLRPTLATLADHGTPARLLDIGTGAGDVLRRIVTLAQRDGFGVHALGIDPDERALSVALAADPMPSVTFERTDSAELVRRGEQYDLVLSNHLLHHLTDLRVLDDSETLASHLSVHSDIARSRLAYAAYAVGVLPITLGTFLRTDGLRSIRRSYTRDELAASLPPRWRAEQQSRFRLLAVHRA